MKLFRLLLIFILLSASLANASEPLILNVAHRGACGYLPEHTIAAKALAFAMGAHYLEQDVSISKDDVPIVIHDIYLDAVTDVATKFPGRARKDGKHYVVDFTFAEIKQLKAQEVVLLDSGKQRFPNRFPTGKSYFKLSSLREELEFIQGLNKSTGRQVGIYPELKNPAWHSQNGKDISKIVLKVLNEFGYSEATDMCLLQSFDADELKRVKNELKSELRLIYLMDSAEIDLEDTAGFAFGIGPSIGHILTGADEEGKPILTDLVNAAHKHGLKVHPYTFRVDMLPDGVTSEQLLDVLFKKAGIDGIFSDFPDVTANYIKTLTK